VVIDGKLDAASGFAPGPDGDLLFGRAEEAVGAALFV
jgi:hypothetical protein